MKTKLILRLIWLVILVISTTGIVVGFIRDGLTVMNIVVTVAGVSFWSEEIIFFRNYFKNKKNAHTEKE